MNIVQLLPELNEGGVERGVVELSRELVKLGHESIVISNGGKQAEQIGLDGGRHITLDICSKNLLTVPSRMLQLRRCLRELNPDVIHARSRVPAWLAWLANKPLKIPFVTTVHGFNSVNRYSRVMTYGDRVICVSHAIKEYIQRHYAVPDIIIHVIPRGIDLEAFSPKNLNQKFIKDFSTKYSLDGRFIVSSVGRITQLKDYETFIRAINEIRKSEPDVLGLIVGGVNKGKEAYFDGLVKLVEDLSLSDHIVFTGSQKEIASIYALSDVIVSSSNKPESFGRAAAESIAMGIPVVATKHGGVLDIIRSGENGCFFEIGDWHGLASSLQEIKGLSSEGMRDYIARKFSLKQMVDKTVAVYNEVHQV